MSRKRLRKWKKYIDTMAIRRGLKAAEKKIVFYRFFPSLASLAPTLECVILPTMFQKLFNDNFLDFYASCKTFFFLDREILTRNEIGN